MASKKSEAKKAVHPMVHTVAGGLAGGIELALMYPTEYVKTQLQLQNKSSGNARFNNSWHCVTTIVKERGPMGLYRGFTSLLIGTVPKTAVRFTAFGAIKQALKDEKGQLSPMRTLLAGMMTGAVEAAFVVTPVETLKTKLIHDQNRAAPRYNGLVHAVRTIVAEEGLSGVYKGLTATLMKQMTNQGVRFLIFDEVKKLFITDGKPASFSAKVLAGGTAGAISCLVNHPIDTLKSRMQGLEAAQYKSTADCAKRILAEEGPLAFYKGLTARLPRVVLGQAITLSLYDQIAQLIIKTW